MSLLIHADNEGSDYGRNFLHNLQMRVRYLFSATTFIYRMNHQRQHFNVVGTVPHFTNTYTF